MYVSCVYQCIFLSVCCLLFGNTWADYIYISSIFSLPSSEQSLINVHWNVIAWVWQIKSAEMLLVFSEWVMLSLIGE